MEIKKVVMKLNIHDDKDKQKAMKAVSSLTGINSVEVDLKESKMTVIGDADPVDVVSKLKKPWNAQIVTVGPPKEEKKDDKKDGKKDEKKDDKKDDKKEKEEKEKKEKEEKEKQIAELLRLYRLHNPPVYYCYQTIEDNNPNACVIL